MLKLERSLAFCRSIPNTLLPQTEACISTIKRFLFFCNYCRYCKRKVSYLGFSLMIVTQWDERELDPMLFGFENLCKLYVVVSVIGIYWLTVFTLEHTLPTELEKWLRVFGVTLYFQLCLHCTHEVSHKQLLSMKAHTDLLKSWCYNRALIRYCSL